MHIRLSRIGGCSLTCPFSMLLARRMHPGKVSLCDLIRPKPVPGTTRLGLRSRQHPFFSLLSRASVFVTFKRRLRLPNRLILLPQIFPFRRVADQLVLLLFTTRRSWPIDILPFTVAHVSILQPFCPSHIRFQFPGRQSRSNDSTTGILVTIRPYLWHLIHLLFLCHLLAKVRRQRRSNHGFRIRNFFPLLVLLQPNLHTNNTLLHTYSPCNIPKPPPQKDATS
mmetsp:Transcript_24967/g.98646  ORF Transcript_24967/g.98646 Transcript_24967/m.98646 type:complete len:224 (-) Transcript_24967:73-744(-)